MTDHRQQSLQLGVPGAAQPHHDRPVIATFAGPRARAQSRPEPFAGAAQAAEAGVRVAAASGALGPGAAPSAGARLRADLPLLLGAAPAPARARAQLTLAEGLLSAASAAQLAADPDRRARPGWLGWATLPYVPGLSACDDPRLCSS